MVRCRNSENVPVIEIVQSPSAIEHLLLIFECYLIYPVSSVLENQSDHGKPGLTFYPWA